MTGRLVAVAAVPALALPAVALTGISVSLACVLLAVVTLVPALLAIAGTVRGDRRRNAVWGAQWDAELARRTRRDRKPRPRQITAGTGER